MNTPTKPNPTRTDPLLRPGVFIHPNTPSSGKGKGNGNGNGKTPKRETTGGSDQKSGSSLDVTNDSNRPDWLPSGWKFKEYLRTAGASAGTRDKYFIDPVTNRRFRSRKEVFRFLEDGTTPSQKKKTADSDANNSLNLATVKRKKPDPKAKISIDNFKFDDVPQKVTWVLTDVYEGTWSAKTNVVDKVPESSQQEWYSAFRYLTLKNSGCGMF
ncbi:hypothetical protein vseg_013154 [Gypsophila vaccaria]